MINVTLLLQTVTLLLQTVTNRYVTVTNCYITVTNRYVTVTLPLRYRIWTKPEEKCPDGVANGYT